MASRPSVEFELTPERPRGAGRFVEMLHQGSISVIAEFKRQSPFDGAITDGREVAETVRAYDAGGASAISVLTTPDFGGSVEDLRTARRVTDKPILAKGIYRTAEELAAVREAGADAALLVVGEQSGIGLADLHQAGRKLGLEMLVEVHELHEIGRAAATGARMMCVNNRDLRDGTLYPDRASRLERFIPPDVHLVAASGVTSRSQVSRYGRSGGFHGVLVGTSLMRAADPEAAVRELVAG